MSDDNVTEFRKRNFEQKPEQEKLKQYAYAITRIVNGDVIMFEQTGHLIVTSINLALLDEEENLTFLCPNDNNLVSVEIVADAEAA